MVLEDLPTAMDLLAKEGEMTPEDAKATLLHISRDGNKCHWCQNILEVQGQIECGKCRSLNFVW